MFKKLGIFSRPPTQNGIVHSRPSQCQQRVATIPTSAQHPPTTTHYENSSSMVQPLIPPPSAPFPPEGNQQGGHGEGAIPAENVGDLGDLTTDFKLRLLFIRKVYSILFLQTLFLLGTSILIITYYPEYAKSVIATSETYNDAAWTVGAVGFCLSGGLSIVKRKSWWVKWYIVVPAFLTVGSCIAYLVAYNLALYMDYNYHAIVIIGSLSVTFLATIMFTLQPYLDFNALYGLLLSIPMAILSSTILISCAPSGMIPPAVVGSLVVSRIIAVVLVTQVALLLVNMMTFSMGDGCCCDCCCGQCCGCGIDLKKTKEQWPVAVFQIYLCIPITVMLLVVSFISFLCSMLGQESGSEREGRLGREQAESDRQRADIAWTNANRYW